MPTLRDRALWGLLYAAGLRTEEALALRWSDVRGLTSGGGTLAIDRTVVTGRVRETTITGRGRDVEIVPTLAADLLDLRATTGEHNLDPDALIVASRAGTPLNPNNWRNRTFNPAALSVGVPRATPYTGRHTYISLQIHAGVSPVIVAAIAGNSPEVIWKHYAREFDRARSAPSAPLADALATARARVGGVVNVLPSTERPPVEDRP